VTVPHHLVITASGEQHRRSERDGWRWRHPREMERGPFNCTEQALQKRSWHKYLACQQPNPSNLYHVHVTLGAFSVDILWSYRWNHNHCFAKKKIDSLCYIFYI